MKRKGILKERIIVAVIALIALLACAVMVSCGNDKSVENAVSGSTVLETNEEGETVVVATDKTGETLVYETDKSGNVKESKVSNTKATSKAADKTASKSSAKATTAATKATSAQVCYITVEGYCSSKSISLQGGDTAYSILKRSGASVSAENTGYGVYVKGINGKYEFDEGPSSGWVYTVNGSSLNVSCGSCSIKSGDRISWKYVK